MTSLKEKGFTFKRFDSHLSNVFRVLSHPRLTSKTHPRKWASMGVKIKKSHTIKSRKTSLACKIDPETSVFVFLSASVSTSKSKNKCPALLFQPDLCFLFSQDLDSVTWLGKESDYLLLIIILVFLVVSQQHLALDLSALCFCRCSWCLDLKVQSNQETSDGTFYSTPNDSSNSWLPGWTSSSRLHYPIPMMRYALLLYLFITIICIWKHTIQSLARNTFLSLTLNDNHWVIILCFPFLLFLNDLINSIVITRQTSFLSKRRSRWSSSLKCR